MIKVAVLGPRDLAVRICEIGSRFESIELVPYVYQDERETLDILRKCASQADIVLFTGPIPYYMARNTHIDIPMYYVSYSVSAFYQVLFRHMQSKGWQPKTPLRISIDTIGRRSVENMLRENELNNFSVYALEYQDYVNKTQLMDFHRQLYAAGKTDFAITGLTSAYDGLREAGVPVYRLVITDTAIRAVLDLVEMEARNITAQNGQLCVGAVHIRISAASGQTPPSEYEYRRLRLMFMNQFINFCEEIKASIRVDGDDEYVFYTTRGMIERLTRGYQIGPVIDKQGLPFDVFIGLGYGRSANAAERGGKEALTHAVQYGKSSCFCRLEDGSIQGILGTGDTLNYQTRTEDPLLLDLSHDSQVSVSTLSKICSLFENHDMQALSANEVAETLNITLRSARRILKSLEDALAVEAAGEEQPAGRGRPRKVYRPLKIKNLQLSATLD